MTPSVHRCMQVRIASFGYPMRTEKRTGVRAEQGPLSHSGFLSIPIHRILLIRWGPSNPPHQIPLLMSAESIHNGGRGYVKPLQGARTGVSQLSG